MRRRNPSWNSVTWEPTASRTRDRLFYQLWKKTLQAGITLDRWERAGPLYKDWLEETDHGRHELDEPLDMSSVWEEVCFAVEGVPLLLTRRTYTAQPYSYRFTPSPSFYKHNAVWGVNIEHFYNPDAVWDFNIKAPIDYILPIKRTHK